MGDSERRRGGPLDRLFALHAALCDRLVLPSVEPAPEGDARARVFRVFEFAI